MKKVLFVLLALGLFWSCDSKKSDEAVASNGWSSRWLVNIRMLNSTALRWLRLGRRGMFPPKLRDLMPCVSFALNFPIKRKLGTR